MPIITGQTAQASDFIDTSAGAADAGRVPKLNSTGKLDTSFTKFGFGGTGADGILSISSGTTVIDLQNKAIVIRNYTYISITGSAKLAFTNPASNGTIIVLKSQGDVTITSSAVPAIDASGMGASGSTQGISNFIVVTNSGYGGIGGGSLPPVAQPVAVPASIFSPFYKTPILACGAGGGNGNGGASPGQTFSGGGGGASLINPGGAAGTHGSNNGYGGAGATGANGGGAFLIECGGTCICSSTLWSRGNAGNPPRESNNNQAGSGGGGGGCLGIIYNFLGSDTGTYDTSGGLGGPASGGQSATGGPGGTGYCFRYQNTEL